MSADILPYCSLVAFIVQPIKIRRLNLLSGLNESFAYQSIDVELKPKLEGHSLNVARHVVSIVFGIVNCRLDFRWLVRHRTFGVRLTDGRRGATFTRFAAHGPAEVGAADQRCPFAKSSRRVTTMGLSDDIVARSHRPERLVRDFRRPNAP